MKRLECVSELYSFLDWAYNAGYKVERRTRKSGLYIWETEDDVLASQKEGGYYMVNSTMYSRFEVYMENPEVQEWYFTYGSNHKTKAGQSLGYHFTVIKGTYGDARAAMVRERGGKWAFQYEKYEQMGVDQFGLSEYNLRAVSLEEKEDA